MTEVVTVDNVKLFINILTLPLGLYMANSSIKLLFPCHPSHGQLTEGFRGPLAKFWGIPGYGWALRLIVGFGKLFCGLGAVIFQWWPEINFLLSFALVGIALIMSGAIVVNFSKGWASMQLPSALFTYAIVLLYLQAIRGVLVEHAITVIGCLLGAKLLLGFALWNKRRFERIHADYTADLLGGSKGPSLARARVEVLARGGVTAKGDGVYYRLV